MTRNGPSIIVIGAGIIGAASAYHLQSRGAQVMIVDAGGETATATSFGWINASFHHDGAHFQLRSEGMAAWQRLAKSLPLDIAWQGALCWEETGTAFDAQRDHLATLGYDVAEIDSAAFAALEPHIATLPARALHFRQEAAADSPEVAQRLLNAALAAGARRLRGVKVLDLVEKGDRIIGIRTEAGVSTADHILIAAGTGSAALIAQAGSSLPMLRRPALMLRTRPVAPVLNHILVSEFGELRQLPDGALMMPAAVNHQGDTSDKLTEPLEITAERVLDRLRTMLPDVALDWEELRLAFRPVPHDGLPVIGPVRAGVHVACMHSGITLGALAGELVAQEMLEGVTNRSAALLAPYRLDRFT